MQEIEVKKAFRLTSKNANKGKRNLIYAVMDEAKKIKNEISKFVFENIYDLLDEINEIGKCNKFISNYRRWNEIANYLISHTIQTMFKDVCLFYVNHIKQIINNLEKPFEIQIGYEISDKSRTYKIISKESKFKALISYLFAYSNLIYYNDINDAEEKLMKIKKKKLKILYNMWYNLDDTKKNSIIKIVNLKIEKARDKIKQIKFKNGSFRLTTSGYSYEIVKDEDNKKYKFFLKLRFKNKQIVYLPLLLEENPKNKRTKRYFNEILNGNLDKQIFIIDRRQDKNTKKLFFAVTKDTKLTLKDFCKIVGCDINLTFEKFLTCSNGFVAKFNEKIMKEFLEFVKKIDEKGYNKLTKNEKKRLRKLLRIMKWYLDLTIAELVNKLVKEGYTDIVLEDLKAFRNGKFEIELFGYKMKLNRFVRFMHLTGLKERFIQIAHNRGIRVHLTKSNYTSQMCPICGNIEKGNRNGRNFKCKNCGFTNDADHNASINILLRYTYEDYRKKLHDVDKNTNELIPKKMKSEKFLDYLKNLFDVCKIKKTFVSLVDVLPDDYVQKALNHLNYIINNQAKLA